MIMFKMSILMWWFLFFLVNSESLTHSKQGILSLCFPAQVPSTMANIMDLLQDYKRTIKINDNISLPYIFYQASIYLTTIFWLIVFILFCINIL